MSVHREAIEMGLLGRDVGLELGMAAVRPGQRPSQPLGRADAPAKIFSRADGADNSSVLAAANHIVKTSSKKKQSKILNSGVPGFYCTRQSQLKIKFRSPTTMFESPRRIWAQRSHAVPHSS